MKFYYVYVFCKHASNEKSQAVSGGNQRIRYNSVDSILDCYQVVDKDGKVLYEKRLTCSMYGWKNRKVRVESEDSRAYKAAKKRAEDYENNLNRV